MEPVRPCGVALELGVGLRLPLRGDDTARRAISSDDDTLSMILRESESDGAAASPLPLAGFSDGLAGAAGLAAPPFDVAAASTSDGSHSGLLCPADSRKASRSRQLPTTLSSSLGASSVLASSSSACGDAIVLSLRWCWWWLGSISTGGGSMPSARLQMGRMPSPPSPRSIDDCSSSSSL
jgi:hypothetical protein